ncbi:MAG: IgA Peptidase M64 [Bacteroidetes bacterium ADurb.Bin234]|nr:MAG: IgA Peptidase M64 [Bacteroidetes bacterium ADurb.Bin234]
MKKSLILLCLLSIQLILPAQDFNTYFHPKTLRINYIHSGTKDKDSIEVKNYQVDNLWAGSLTNLIDSYDYGCHKIMVYDVKTNQLIYSRTYSCLFGEYRTTEKGATQSKAFKETIRCPYPKKPVRIEFLTRNQHSDFEKRQEIIVNPKKIKALANTIHYDVIDLHIGGNYNKAYDLVIVPEGYAMQDSAKLREDVTRCKNAIMECTPFKESATKINIRAVVSYSEESGISQETKGKEVKTILGSAFYSLDLERYLMLDHVWQLHNVCANAPYDNIIILCNTKKYGGGGIYNWYATVSDNKHFNYVSVHELGHSIAGLADEYYTSEVTVQDFYPKGSEPKEPNITSLVNFESKWKSMLASDTPIPTPVTDENKDVLGVYEGAGYCAEGLYRPWISCTMKDIVYNKFCPVCQKALIEMFDFYAE